MMNVLVSLLLRLMAFVFNFRPSLQKYLMSTDGPINFTVGFKTENGTLNKAIDFNNGKVRVLKETPLNADVSLRFLNGKTVFEMLSITPNEMLLLILHNKMILDGNIAYLQLFNFYISLLMGRKHKRMLQKAHKRDVKERKIKYGTKKINSDTELLDRKKHFIKATSVDKNVQFLTDPYLSEYSIDDFPRLQWMLDRHFNIMPELCVERPQLLTQWFRENGFEKDKNNDEHIPVLRQAEAYRFLMENKKPVIAQRDLIAGTSTAKEPTGVIIYPDAQGTMLWGELKSIEERVLNPYKITEEDAYILHHEILPFWAKRNFREYVRHTFDYPDCLKIDERWVYYFVWKSVGISHTIPDFPTILEKGTEGMIQEIDEKLNLLSLSDNEKRNNLSAMKTTLEALNLYAENLSKEALRLSEKESDNVRKSELKIISNICARVPRKPTETLDEAINAIWITWVAVHMENTNTGLSLGRLDQWLQPYFLSDMKKISSAEEKDTYIKHAIEISACLFMRGTDHLPLVPDIGNYLFGGSSSDQAITLGGVTPDGKDGVSDMTYILLKVTEMLSIRDPNVNARYHSHENSEAYLKRLCEVNYITAATPSMHNDVSVFESLKGKSYAIEDIRNWSATGCVEPTLSGKHMGHTGSILMNMVAALEMALNNGTHPHVNWQLGPKTGSIEASDFKSFDDFFEAYMKQQKFLIDNAVQLNNFYAEAHCQYRPTPFLSTLIQGSVDKGLDVTEGGALYNSSGSSNIGLADVTDSLMVIKKLVFDEKKITFQELKDAIDSDFINRPDLHTMVQKKVPCFGSGDSEALTMAQRIAEFIHQTYQSHQNARGGSYTSGFWSMSQHVAYGDLSGTLPSGRIRRKAFTPGLTPQPSASKSFLDNIKDVAQLNPQYLDNNIAFNVKLVPDPDESSEDAVNAMYSYVKTYFDMGGMQMQFNVVNSKTLKDAMAYPERYKNLLVRISGYNAYFVTLNKEMQIELIERAEYGVN